MKTKSFFFSILLLFLSVTMFTSCSPNSTPNSTDEELYEIEKSASGKSGQGSTGGKGGHTEPDNL